MRTSLTAAVVAGALCLATTTPAHANLVVDPGFESDPPGTLSPPWFGDGAIACDAACAPPPHAPHSGSLAAQFYGFDAPGYLFQEIPTIPGQTYEFGFWLAGDGFPYNRFVATWDDRSSFDESGVTGTDWVLFSFVVGATGTNTVIRFFGTSHLQLDDVFVTPVSEPAPLSLLGLALAGLGVLRGRRYRSAPKRRSVLSPAMAVYGRGKEKARSRRAS